MHLHHLRSCSFSTSPLAGGTNIFAGMQPVAQPSMVVVKTSTGNTAQQVRQSPVQQQQPRQQQQQQQQQRLPSFASTQAQKGNSSFTSVSYVQGTSPTPSSSQQLPTSPVIQSPQQQQSPKIVPSFTSPVQQVRHSPAVVQQHQSPNNSNPGYFTSPTSSAVSRNFVSTSPNSGKQPQQQQIVLSGYSPSQQQPQQPQQQQQQYVMSTAQQMPNMSTLEKTAQQQLQMNAQSGAYFSVQKQ